jgi:single-strand DNA-binding protein
MNKALILGNLGDAPVLKNVGSTPCANFSVATNHDYTDTRGERQTRVEWHRIVVWGNQASACAKYLDKGRQVLVEGEIRYRSWEAPVDRDRPNGPTVTKYITEIVAERVTFLGGPRRDDQRDDVPPPRDEDYDRHAPRDHYDPESRGSTGGRGRG